MQMKMAMQFMDMNWDVVLSQLPRELGFVSEAAHKYVRKGSDHHKTMSILKVAYVGLWQEKSIPHVSERLSSGSSVSVRDYLYTWLPNNCKYSITLNKPAPRHFHLFSYFWELVTPSSFQNQFINCTRLLNRQLSVVANK